MQLENIDWLIISSFFILSLVIGVVVSKKSGKDVTEFFLSGRKMPWWLLGISMVATTTTHKVLRGPRGGLILTNNEEISKKINSAIFPGIQGGPLMHTIAAKAVSFGESLQPEFHLYTENVLKNAKALSSTLMDDGFDIVSGGTDTHIVLVDLRPKGIKGNIAEESLGRAGITCNKNGVPFDPEKPMITSGIRLGSPACTTRGFNVSEFNIVGDLICEVLNSISNNNNEPVEEVEKSVKIKVEKLCSKFPIYEK